MSSPQAAPDAGVSKSGNFLANNGVTKDDGSSNTSNLPESSGKDNPKKNSQLNEKSGGPNGTTSSGGKTPSFHYDPDKLTLKFIFANRDGLTVILDCKPTDTIGEVKGALLSIWPEDVPECSGGDKLRLICMGKGILMPDTKTLESAEVPIFKTHATPVNVSVKPDFTEDGLVKGSPKKSAAGTSGGGSGGGGASTGNENGAGSGSAPASTGCSCVIL